jgi:hypothetical protein
MKKTLLAATLTLTCLASMTSMAAAQDPSSKLLQVPANHIGLHGMVFPQTPFSAKQELFRQSAAVGASYLRVDLSLGDIFLRGEYRGKAFDVERWDRADQYALLANMYGVKPLAIISATPADMADCPSSVSKEDAYHCPPNDLKRYQAMVGKVAARYAGVIDHFEILNEPDSGQFFYGNVEQYGAMLNAAADGIHAANPNAKVLLGGISGVSDTTFTDQLFASNPSLASKIDISNIHLRSSAWGAGKIVARWKEYFAAHGVKGPLWLTEFGYPSDSLFQFDINYRGGEQQQADFLQDVLPRVLAAGAEMIFVTAREWGGGQFASEGILDAPDPLPEFPLVRRKPAFQVVKAAAANLQPAPPAGATALSRRQGRSLTLNKGKMQIDLLFACQSAGDCPSSAFRLKLATGSSYRIRCPEIKAGRSLMVQVGLTNTSRLLLKRSGKKGLQLLLLADGSANRVQLKLRRR